ncbi:uncharacterized protein L969DRAFT_79376 [Mixia osmundae IAM 14324]|uniref:Uncharacterized protein n=1 Tax=Mixia osmundae (strain CBS 9802 / IAM 14324 / JCM 22182 / KY 12970) TaxID=764103 RepID=G7E2J1_MIXOS|nr:uncharacterized protein L969DRAFT_79376 [Mixia osmundae IAM 14324]KEI36923.1 hypothetical protein L969DRAFT_79376 [Mixia osmundae IAM 14324]GAA97051.1 hypothetical protein E5Q_03726 [Mixia osmundae IAM 14324]
MAQKAMSANPFKYMTTEKSPFWRKFREALVVNPESSTGVPLATSNRFPTPGSREEGYRMPASKATDPAFNPYYKRDFRRMYPKVEMVTQDHLSNLLLAQPEGLALPKPGAAKVDNIASADGKSLATLPQPPPSLSSLYFTEAAPTQSSWKPPLPPTQKKIRYAQSSEPINADEHAYHPTVNYVAY